MAVGVFGYGEAFTNPLLGGRLDPTYGYVKAVHYGWTHGTDAGSYEYWNEVETHQCTEEELGLNGDPNNHQFMKGNAEEIS